MGLGSDLGKNVDSEATCMINFVNIFSGQCKACVHPKSWEQGGSGGIL